MNKTVIALASVLALSAGFTSQANAGKGCWGTVHAVCDWLYPTDTTVETEKDYGSCMATGGQLCSVEREDQVTPANLKRLVEQSPRPDNLTLKKYERPGWQNATKKKPSR